MAKIKRRTLLMALGSAVAYAGPASAQQQVDVRQEMIALNAATQLSVAVGNRSGAFRGGLRDLVALSRMDPRWGSWADSAELSHLLFSLADPNDMGSYITVSQMVVGSWTGYGNMRGSMGKAMRTICAACSVLLQNPAAFSSMQVSRGETAVMLLSFSAMAPGPERNAWAQLGLRETRVHGQRVLAIWSRDNLTGRWTTVGTALAGDFPAARTQYEAVLVNQTGVMQNAAEGRRAPARSIGELVVNGLDSGITALTGGTHIGGLAQTIAGMPALMAEGGTIALLAGDQTRAMELLENARTDASLVEGSETSGGANAISLEDRLTRSGATIVQVATTTLGCLAIVSQRRANRVQRTSNMDYVPGGFAFLETMGGWQDGFTRHQGLLQKYDRANRANARRIQREMTEYVGLASEGAELLAGNAIRTALRQANVRPDADVLIIVPPALASLPIGLARTANEAPLAELYQLRFATSLRAAWACEERRLAHQQTAPSIALIAAGGRNAPPFASFESAAVNGHFPPAQRRAIAQSSSPIALLSAMQGAQYWHIASHGVWNFRHQDRSGLMLAGEDPTTVTDILAFHADPAPRLAFLSACETNLVNTEHDLNTFVGLNTAFLSAGAAGVVGTQWAVNDAATALLSARFYAEHIGGGKSPAAALKAAQTWLRTSSAASLSQFVEGLIETAAVPAEQTDAITGYLADQTGDAAPFADTYFWGGFQLFGV